MNMPGFSAEGSLYKSRGHYVGRNSFAALASAGVTPQLPIGFCMSACDDHYDWGSIENSACKMGCMGGGDGGGGGGGGGGGSGPSDCVLCLRGCLRKPAARRAACRADCHEFSC
jgi:hypothetical protein